MVGAGTARAEARASKSDELRQIREVRGHARRAGVVVSGRLELPPDLPLLNEPDQRVVIATTSEDVAGRDRRRRVRRVGDDLPRLMAYLQERHAVRSVLRGRADAQLVPVRGGPRGRAVPDFEPEGPGRRERDHDRRRPRAGRARRAGLVSIAEAEGELFTRWRFSH